MPLITENMIFSSLRNGVEIAAWNLQVAQLHASSGRRVLQASDDPAAAAQGAVLSTGLQSLADMQGAANYVTTQGTASSQAIASAQTLIARAKEIAVQGSTGSAGATDRDALAQEVQQLHDSLLALANTQEAGVYVFGGFASGAAPFDATGAYQGDDGVHDVEVAPGHFVAMNVPGSQVFNVVGGQNIIGALSALQADLQASNISNLQADMDTLDASVTQLSQAQAQVGSMLAVLQTAATARQNMNILLAAQRAALTEADPAVAITDMMRAQSAYEAAVTEASRMLDAFNNRLTR